MGSVTIRNGRIIMDFRFQGVRCRERTKYIDTPENRALAEAVMKKIEAEIILGSFDYEKYFPESPKVNTFKANETLMKSSKMKIPLFCNFAPIWFNENKARWRQAHQTNVTQNLRNHLIQAFGNEIISEITKSDFLNFRSMLSQPDDDALPIYSEATINKITNIMRMIMTEASERFDFPNPMQGVKNLKVRRTHIEPFTLDEVMKLLKIVRKDFRNYYTIRFFTGMRTSEIDGLQWKYVDFDRKQILIRETIVQGRMEYTKTDSSQREIHMNQMVFDALRDQRIKTSDKQFVFVNSVGNHLDYNKVSKRIWAPLLHAAGLKYRRAYETRHTAATLMLASGENPEFVARQLGHSTTEMLFRVYSRYIPNLTRQDGTAFEKLVAQYENDEGNNHE